MGSIASQNLTQVRSSPEIRRVDCRWLVTDFRLVGSEISPTHGLEAMPAGYNWPRQFFRRVRHEETPQPTRTVSETKLGNAAAWVGHRA